MKKTQKLETLFGKLSRDNFFFNISETIIIKVKLVLGEITKMPLLNSIMTQKGLSIDNFFKDFTASAMPHWEHATSLPVTVFITPEKTFFFEINKPNIFETLNEIFSFKTMKKIKLWRKNKKREILAVSFFAISVFLFFFDDKTLLSNIKQIVGTYRSSNNADLPVNLKMYKFKKKKK